MIEQPNHSQPLLAICIPTFNRCEILIECLEDTIAKVSKFNLPIIVSDNCSTDNTQKEVEKLAALYPQLFYYRQTENVGADRNFEASLKLSPAKYCWLLGDSYRIVEVELQNILTILESEKYCVFINNAFNRERTVPTQVYNNSDKLLYDIGWHINLMCSLIFHRDLINNANFVRYYNTNFIQNGIIFEHLCVNKSALVYWYNQSCNTNTAIQKASWMNMRWDVFGIAWTNYVMSLPAEISLPTKLKCIKEHNRKTYIFTISKCVTMRREGTFDLAVARRCKASVPYFCDIPYGVLWLIAVAPKSILRFVLSIWNFVKRLKSNRNK